MDQNEVHPEYFQYKTSLVAWWAERLTTNLEVPGSIPEFFLERGRHPWLPWSG